MVRAHIEEGCLTADDRDLCQMVGAEEWFPQTCDNTQMRRRDGELCETPAESLHKRLSSAQACLL